MGNKVGGWSVQISDGDDEADVFQKSLDTSRKKKKGKDEIKAEDFINKPPKNFKIKSDKLSEEELVNKAKDSMKKGDFHASVHLCSLAVKKNENFIDGYLERASTFILLGEIELAKNDLNLAKEKEPTNPKVLLARGNALNKERRYKEAIVELKLCIEHNPDVVKGYVSLGNCFFHLRDHEKAELNYKAALEKDPNCVNALHNLGTICNKDGKYEDGREYFKKVLEIDDKFVRSMNGIGNSYFKEQNYEEAMKFYEESIETKESNPQALVGAGNCYYYQKNYKEAIKCFEKSLELDPKQADAYITYSLSYKALRKPKMALEIISEGLKHFPEHPNYYLERSQILMEMSQYNESNEELTTIIRILEKKKNSAIIDILEDGDGDGEDDDKDGSRIVFLAEAYLKQGNVFFKITKMKKALQCYNKAIELSPEYSVLWEKRGTVNYVGGEFEMAFKDFSRSKQLDKELERIDEKLKIVCTHGIEKSDMLLQKGGKSDKVEKERAIWVERMSKLDESWFDPRTILMKNLDDLNEEELIFRGNLCYDFGKLKEAMECYGKILEKDENHVNALNGMGACEFRQKEYEKAIDNFQKALEKDPKSVTAHQMKGDVYKEMGKYKEAIKCYDSASEIENGNPKPLHDMGVCFYFLNEYQHALDQFTKSIQCNPEYVYALSNRGETNLKMNRIKDAYSDFLAALRIDSKFQSAIRGRKKCEYIFKKGLCK